MHIQGSSNIPKIRTTIFTMTYKAHTIWLPTSLALSHHLGTWGNLPNSGLPSAVPCASLYLPPTWPTAVLRVKIFALENLSWCFKSNRSFFISPASTPHIANGQLCDSVLRSPPLNWVLLKGPELIHLVHCSIHGPWGMEGTQSIFVK